MSSPVIIDLTEGPTEQPIEFYWTERLRIQIPEIPAGSYSELRVANDLITAPLLIERGRSQIDLPFEDYSGGLSEGGEYIYMILVIGAEPSVVRSGSFKALDIIDGDASIPANAYTYEGEPLTYDGDGTIYTYSAA